MSGLGFWFQVWVLGFGSGFRVSGFGFRFSGLGFEVYRLGFRDQGWDIGLGLVLGLVMKNSGVEDWDLGSGE